MAAQKPIGNLVEEVLRWEPSNSSGEFLYIDLGSIDRDTKAVTSPSVIACSDAPSRARQLVRAGDVLVSTVRPNLNAVAHVSREHDGATASTGFSVLRPGPSVDGRYLFHWVRTRRFVEEMTRRSTGASYPAVSDQIVKSSAIPLPPLEEQRRIAAMLDAADELREKRRQSLAKLDILTQAIFLEMFGHPRSDGSSFERAPLGELVENEDSIRVPVKLSDREDMDGEYPYYGASGIIDYVDDYLFEGRRLLVAEDGANLLARTSPVAFLADGKYWVNNHAHVLADNGRANLVYLRQAIELLDLSPFVTGSAQPKLNRSKLDSILITVPTRTLQDEFESRVARLQSIEATCRSHLEKLDSLYGSLQQRAFRGDL